MQKLSRSLGTHSTPPLKLMSRILERVSFPVELREEVLRLRLLDLGFRGALGCSQLQSLSHIKHKAGTEVNGTKFMDLFFGLRTSLSSFGNSNSSCNFYNFGGTWGRPPTTSC